MDTCVKQSRDLRTDLFVSKSGSQNFINRWEIIQSSSLTTRRTKTFSIHMFEKTKQTLTYKVKDKEKSKEKLK